MNYKVTAASSTDELLTLGQLLAEVGDYASTILDKAHLSLARRCARKLKIVVSELMSRQRIQSSDDLYLMPDNSSETPDLSSMSIAELHNLYRRRPLNRDESMLQGRESAPFSYEQSIVNELLTRRAKTRDEQLKIDYCVAILEAEIEDFGYRNDNQ